MGVERKDIGVSEMLKNALHWKQWMVDDFRILIELGEQGDIDKKSLYKLVLHHLQTYKLVNQTYVFLTGDEDDKLFDLPNIEELQEILPTLDLSNLSTEGIIEPMLELELDDLSEELYEDALVVNQVDESDEDEDVIEIEEEMTQEDELIEDEDGDSFVDGLDLEDPMDDVIYDDVGVDVPSDEQLQEDSTNSRTDVSTTDIVGRLWGNLSNNALVNNEVNEGDVDDDEGRNE